MRWPTAGLWALSVLVLAGCVEDFAKEGRIDKAIHKDVMERLRKNCTDKDIHKYCPAGSEQSVECLKKCGGQ